MKPMRAVLMFEDGLWSASYPQLHCWGIGKTKTSAVADLKEAAQLMLSYLKEVGKETP